MGDWPPRALVGGILKVAGVLGIILGLGIVLDRLLPPLPLPPETLTVSGLALIAIGISLEAYSTLTFVASGKGTPNPLNPPERLVRQGPYAYSRNPLYVARLSILSGAAAALQSYGIVLMTLLLFLGIEFILLPREEKRLMARFGEAYREYYRRTPRWLLLRSRRQRSEQMSPRSLGKTPQR